ncbi:MAG: FAD-dependent oxidoreductase [Chloroflexi bacterium]|jgi:sarcosine oxidase subunit beta|nr:FAD-dependent oxidoreductase [Chloroflexota bacterium]
MTKTAEFLVIGGGVIGCSTAYNLAKHGAHDVVLLERGDLCSGGTAKSCAIIRTHYSIESNLNHAVESLKIFANFDEVVGGDAGFRRTGYIILGPEAHRASMEAVFRKQNEHGIDTAVLTPQEARDIHPLLQYDDAGVIGYDSFTGYADPYLTTIAYASRAQGLGVEFHTDAAVTDITLNGRLKIVHTNRGDFTAPTVIMAAGPWTNQLGQMVGMEFPYEISRHKVITLKAEEPYRLDWPIVKDLTTPEKIYFRPETGGYVLLGTGDHGDPIEDPDSLIDHVDGAHIEKMADLIAHRMPAFAEASVTAGWTGPYDITPDWNPIVGEVPGHEGLYVAVGFSGHGFKLAPTIGEGLAQMVLEKDIRVPITPYAMDRFLSGELLQGAYGIGSIS